MPIQSLSEMQMTKTEDVRVVALSLSPEGHVYLDENTQTQEALPLLLFEKLKVFFIKAHALGLLQLGIQEFSGPLPSSFLFWRSFSRHFVTQICNSLQPFPH